VVIATQIEINQLDVGSWYIGRGRHGNIGLWDGETFLVIGEQGILTGLSGKDKWRKEFGIKKEPYFIWDHPENHTSENLDLNLGTFQPFMKISEGDVISNRGEHDLDSLRGYGLKIGFESIEKW